MIILIGMRGAGKSLIGNIIAELTGMNLIDMDIEIEKQFNMTITEIVATFGWDGFRQREANLLENTVQKSDKNTIIATGGGIITTEQARSFLKKQKTVIQILCPIKEIVHWLSKETQVPTDKNTSERRPDFSLSIEETYSNRKQYYFDCSTHDFCFVPSTDFSSLKNKVSNFLFKINHSYLPNIFQKGYFPVCRYLSNKDLSNRGSTDLGIGSDATLISIQLLSEVLRIDSSQTSLSCDQRILFCNKLHDLRLVSSLPIVLLCDTESTFSLDLQRDICICFARTGGEFIYFINYNLELKLYKTFIFTKKVDFVLAKDFRFQADFKRYFLFGNPIEASPSPIMHNTAFSCIHETETDVDFDQVIFTVQGDISNSSLEFSELSGKTLATISQLRRQSYYLCQTNDIDVVKSTIFQSNFAGANVTIPFKEKVSGFLNKLSESATNIGAVNTIKKLGSGEYVGDNTDWIGIRDNLLLKLEKRTTKGNALIIGAGGTSLAAIYCLKQLEYSVYIYNRTVEKAMKLAQKFDLKVCTELDMCVDVDIIISTVPSNAKVSIPERLLNMKPVVFEASYKPKYTDIVKQAEIKECKVCFGVDMLITQGIAGQQIWQNKQDFETIEKNIGSISQVVYDFAKY